MRVSAFGLVSVLALLAAAGPAVSQQVGAQQAGDPVTYQQPPAPIAAILDSQPSPTPSLSPDRQTLALVEDHLPQVVDPVALVSVFVGQHHGVEALDPGCQQLLAHVRRGVDQDKRWLRSAGRPGSYED